MLVGLESCSTRACHMLTERHLHYPASWPPTHPIVPAAARQRAHPTPTACTTALSLPAGRGVGRPVDYVLYVTSVPCQAGTMAYAGVCAVGGDDSRPIMGAINLCRGAFEELGARRQLETVTHELLHAFVSVTGGCYITAHMNRLVDASKQHPGGICAQGCCSCKLACACVFAVLQVFSPSLFPLFKAGDPRRNVSGPYGATTALASPAVVAALRQLSGCASAAGVPLEDEGSGGSRGSHW